MEGGKKGEKKKKQILLNVVLESNESYILTDGEVQKKQHHSKIVQVESKLTPVGPGILLPRLEEWWVWVLGKCVQKTLREFTQIACNRFSTSNNLKNYSSFPRQIHMVCSVSSNSSVLSTFTLAQNLSSMKLSSVFKIAIKSFEHSCQEIKCYQVKSLWDSGHFPFYWESILSGVSNSTLKKKFYKASDLV